MSLLLSARAALPAPRARRLPIRALLLSAVVEARAWSPAPRAARVVGARFTVADRPQEPSTLVTAGGKGTAVLVYYKQLPPSEDAQSELRRGSSGSV